MKQLVYLILDSYPAEVEILLKIEVQLEKSSDWKRYFGTVRLKPLMTAIEKQEPYIFQDGFNQLCVKRPDTNEYIALDENGILFIYSEARRYTVLCQEAGFENRNEQLISAAGRWRIANENSEVAQRDFISNLKLKLVR